MNNEKILLTIEVNKTDFKIQVSELILKVF